MASFPSLIFPPVGGIAVGGIPHRLRADWPLRLMAGTVIGLSVVIAVALILVLIGVRSVRGEANLGLVLAVNAAMLGYFYVVTRLASGPVVRLIGNSIQVSTGKHTLVVPVSEVARMWIARTGSAYPVLCVATDHSLRPGREWWRLRTLANRRLFGTALAAPLTSTGLTEAGLRDVARHYLDHPDVLTIPPGELASTHRRFRRRLTATLAVMVGLILVGASVSAAGTTSAVPVALAVGLVAAAAVLAVTVAVLCYTVLVPFAGVPWLLADPVLRVGPTGVEHIVRGRLARLPWSQVRRVHITRDPAGTRYLCVTPADPLALMPPVARRAARVRRNQRQHGAPVAAALVGAGLTGEDLLAAVHHYSGGRVAIG